MYEIAVTVIAIMLSVSGIIIGVGYATDNKKLKDLGIEELMQSLINGAIVGALIASFVPGGLFNQIINNVAGSASVSATCENFMQGNYALCFAYNYLLGLTPVSINGIQYPSLASSIFSMLAAVSAAYTALALVGALKISAIFVSITLSGVLNPLLTQLNYLIEAITAMAISVEVQGMLLAFVAATAVPVLLPVGLVLRSALVTRKLGGTIMAIAIGLFAVLPTTYLLNTELITTYSATTGDAALSSIDSIAVAAQANTTSAIEDTNQSSSGGTFALLSYLTGSINGVVSAFQGIIESVINKIALLIVEVFFLPVFSVMLTIISIKEIARLLGSEVSFWGLHI